MRGIDIPNRRPLQFLEWYRYTKQASSAKYLKHLFLFFHTLTYSFYVFFRRILLSDDSILQVLEEDFIPSGSDISDISDEEGEEDDDWAPRKVHDEDDEEEEENDEEHLGARGQPLLVPDNEHNLLLNLFDDLPDPEVGPSTSSGEPSALYLFDHHELEIAKESSLVIKLIF